MQNFTAELIEKIKDMKNNNIPEKKFSENELEILLLASLLEEEQHEYS